VHTPEYKALLEARLVEPVGSSVEQFSNRLRDDVAKWRKVVREGGIKTE